MYTVPITIQTSSPYHTTKLELWEIINICPNTVYLSTQKSVKQPSYVLHIIAITRKPMIFYII